MFKFIFQFTLTETYVKINYFTPSISNKNHFILNSLWLNIFLVKMHFWYTYFFFENLVPYFKIQLYGPPISIFSYF